MIGAAAMSLSSFTVCMNALRLRFFKTTHSADVHVKHRRRKPVARKLHRQRRKRRFPKWQPLRLRITIPCPSKA